MSTSGFLELPSGTNLNITQDTAQLPAWFQSYLSGLVSKASQIAGLPFQQYGNPRLAGFNADQTGSFDLVRSNLGGGAGMINEGASMASAGGAGSSLTASDPYYNAATDYKATGAVQPWLNAAGSMSPTQMARPAIEASTQQFPGAVTEYMSPYIDNAVNRMADVTTRNFHENVIPGLNSTFTGGGTFGGSRHADFTGRAVRDLNNEIAGNAAQMYDTGYGRAADIFNSDKSRLLQAGTNYGQLGATEMANLFNGGALASNATQADANLMAGIGTNRGQMWGNDLSRRLSAGQTLGSLGGQWQDSILKDSAALGTVGNQVQGQQQKSLDLGYSDWMDQLNYPLQQLQIMQSVLQGQPIPGSGRTGISSTPQASTSPLAMLLGLGLGASQLGNLFGGSSPTQAAT